MRKGQSLKCPDCGARLEAPMLDTSVRCTYCGTVVTFELEPPRQPSDPVSEPVRTPRTWIVYPVAAFVCVLIAGIVASKVRRPGGHAAPPALTMKQLLSIDLAMTWEAMATRLGVRARSANELASLRIDHPDFETIGFFWGDKTPTHVKSVSLTPPKGTPVAPHVVSALRAELGRAVTMPTPGNETSIRFHGIYGGVSSHLYFGSNSLETDAEVGARLDVVWLVFQKIVFGATGSISIETKRDVLGTGYPLQLLAKLRLDLPLEGIVSEFDLLFPAAIGERTDRKVPLDHALFETVTVWWQNEPGGRIRQISFSLHDKPDARGLAALTACMSEAFGPAKERVADYAADRRDYFWTAPGFDYLHLSSSGITISAGPGAVSPATTERWQRAIAALDGCTL